MTQHFTPSQNQYIAKLIKKAKAKERARINMNKFTPGQRSEIARLIKKAKAEERVRILKKILTLNNKIYDPIELGIRLEDKIKPKGRKE